MELFLIVTLIRIFVPLVILKFPLLGILLSIIVDLYDWQFLPLNTYQEYENYQIWDKVMDIHFQLVIIAVVVNFKDTVAKNIALLFFSYRLVGLILAFISANRQFLFYFPNFFENFIVLYLLFRTFSKQEKLPSSKVIISIFLFAVVVPKIIHEYFQHFLEKQPWEIYNFGKFIGTSGILQEYINYLSWGTIFYFIPLGAALVLLVKFHKTYSGNKLSS